MNEELAKLSDQQLLSIILPGISTANLLKEYTLNSVFTVVSEEQLGNIRGIGEAKQKTLAVIKEIVQRIQDKKRESITTINGPDDVYEYFKFLENKQQEEFWLLLLNHKNHIIRSEMVSRGSVSASVVDPKVVFNCVVKYMASAVIMVHNHPSGESEPSRDDIKMTKTLLKASDMLQVSIHDHVIIGKYNNTSMKESHSEIWGSVDFSY